MNITTINNSTFGQKNIKSQAVRIIRSVTDPRARVKVNKSGFSVSIPGKEGSIIVNGNTDLLTLSRDFAKVEKAKKAGILKPRHITKISL